MPAGEKIVDQYETVLKQVAMATGNPGGAATAVSAEHPMPASTPDGFFALSASFNRPANTTAYAGGDLVANSASAAVALELPLTFREAGQAVRVERVRLRKSGPTLTNAGFRVHLFREQPTLSVNDNGAFDNGSGVLAISDIAGYVGNVDVSMNFAAVVGLLDFKGNLDCSANPNYPAALTGDAYVVTVAGKIGGASGADVAVGDFIVASANNAGGTQASVGASWFVLEKNLQGALLAANNLSDLGNAATARTNLGLAIGTNVQAYDADLAAIAALTSAADRVPYFTGANTAALATLTTFGRSLIDDADQAAARTTLGLATVAATGSFADLSDKPGIRSTGQNLITTSKTLGAADKGSHILAATSGITITFPSSGFANGEGVMIVNISGGNITLAAPGGSDFGATLPNAGSFVAFCDGGGFWRQFLYTTERL